MILNRSAAKIDIEHSHASIVDVWTGNCLHTMVVLQFQYQCVKLNHKVRTKILVSFIYAHGHIRTGGRERARMNGIYRYWRVIEISRIEYDRLGYLCDWIWHGHCILLMFFSLNNIKRSMLFPRELSFIVQTPFDIIHIYLQNTFAPSYLISWIKLIHVNQICEEQQKIYAEPGMTITKIKIINRTESESKQSANTCDSWERTFAQQEQIHLAFSA